MKYTKILMFSLMLTVSNYSLNASSQIEILYGDVGNFQKSNLMKTLKNVGLSRHQEHKNLQNEEISSPLSTSSSSRQLNLLQIIDDSLPKPEDVTSWDYVRSLFKFSNDDSSFPKNSLIPMNSANFSPPFDLVSQISSAFQLDLDHNVHMQHRIDAFKKLIDQDGRKIVAKHLGISEGKEKNIAFMRNSSEANNAISSGYIFKNSDDQVLLWDENHPTNNVFTWTHKLDDTLESKLDDILVPSSRIIVLPTKSFKKDGKITTQSIIDAFVNAITPKTKVITFTEISNVSGIRIPSKELCEAIRKKDKNIHIHVDGAQSLGDLSLRLEDMDCDSFSSSFHKWLAGPREVGLLYMKEEAIKNFRAPNIIAYDGQIIFPKSSLPKTAARFELLGQRNDASLLAIYTTFKLHEVINQSKNLKDQNADQDQTNISKRVLDLGRILHEKLEANNFELTTPIDSNIRNGTIVVNLEKYQRQGSEPIGDSFYKALYELYEPASKKGVGFITAGALDDGSPKGHQGLRICVNFYNNEKDIENVVNAMVTYRNKLVDY